MLVYKIRQSAGVGSRPKMWPIHALQRCWQARWVTQAQHLILPVVWIGNGSVEMYSYNMTVDIKERSHTEFLQCCKRWEIGRRIKILIDLETKMRILESNCWYSYQYIKKTRYSLTFWSGSATCLGSKSLFNMQGGFADGRADVLRDLPHSQTVWTKGGKRTFPYLHCSGSCSKAPGVKAQKCSSVQATESSRSLDPKRKLPSASTDTARLAAFPNSLFFVSDSSICTLVSASAHLYSFYYQHSVYNMGVKSWCRFIALWLSRIWTNV